MRIELIENPGDDLREAINVELRRHNQTYNPEFWAKVSSPENEKHALNLFALAPEGHALGGLFASTRFSWLEVHLMATKQECRGAGIGRALLAKAEAVEKGRGCRYAYVDTMQYQAPGFYQRAGYRLAGSLPDWDSHGHTKFLFVKDLL